MKKLEEKIKLKLSNHPRRITVSIKLVFLMNVKLHMNLTLSLQTSGVNWQAKFQNLQQPLYPT